MHIPTLTLVAMAFSLISVVLAAAMVFLVMWQAPRRHDNQLMALYLLTVVAWGVGSFMARLNSVLGYDPTVFGYAIALSIALNSWLLLALISHYAGLWRQHPSVVIFLGAVLLLYVGLTPLLFQGRLYNAIHISSEGAFQYNIEPLGYLIMALAYAFYLLALVIIWRSDNDNIANFVGGIIASVGALTALHPMLGNYPLDVILAAAAGLFFTNAVLRQNLFNPLAVINQQLTESEKRLRAVITNEPVILWTADRHAVLTLLDGRGLETLGLKPGEYVGRSAYEVLPDQPAIQDSIRRALAGEEVTDTLEIRHRIQEMKYTPLRDETGEVTGIIGLAIDITERKRSEEALRQSEEKYRTIIEAIEDGYYEVDLSGNITLCNDALCRLLGYERDEVMSSGFRRWMPVSAGREIIKVFNQLYGTGEPLRNYESEITRKDGECRYVEISATVVHDVSGTIVGFRGIARDVTERKHTVAQLNQRMTELQLLRQIEMELADTLDMRSRLTMVLDTVVRLSNADAGFVGLVEGDLVRIVQVIGKYPANMLGSYRTLDQGSMGRVLREQEPTMITDVQADPDYIADLPDTRARIIIPMLSGERLIGVLNAETGHPERFTTEVFELLKLLAARMGVAIDNAQLHRQTEDQLEELRDIYAHVSELEKLKTEMIRIASHDLRSPLSTMGGYVDLLKSDLTGRLSAEETEFFEAIERAITRMHTITGEILSLERIEQAAQQKEQRFDLRTLVEKAVNEHHEQAHLKSQSLRLNLPPDPVMIAGDALQFHEAVANLVGNAIKYTPDSGKIEVSLQHLAGMVRLEVRDNGYGVPADQQAQLFQPFFRAESSETKTIEGTGLGLHLVKTIVERHAGKIIFHSTYGQGSTFGFELPTLKSS